MAAASPLHQTGDVEEVFETELPLMILKI